MCVQSKASLIEGLCCIQSVNRFNRSNRDLRLSLTDNRGLGFWRLNPNLGYSTYVLLRDLNKAYITTADEAVISSRHRYNACVIS